MAAINLNDLLKLYRTPAADADPAVERRSVLRRILATAAGDFPLIQTRGFLTHHAIPEDDGDFHFYIESRESADLPNTPMMTCEIQGMNVQPPDPRTNPFRQHATVLRSS